MQTQIRAQICFLYLVLGEHKNFRFGGGGETHKTPLPRFYSEFNENAPVLNNALAPNEIPNQTSIPNNGNFNPPFQPTLTNNDISHQTNNSPVIKPKFESLFHKKND